MNFRGFLDKDLAKFQTQEPSYSLGQTVFAIMTTIYKGEWDKETLLETSDEEMYKHCLVALKKNESESLDDIHHIQKLIEQNN